MSTPCRIASYSPEGIISIYCHYDGHVMEGGVFDTLSNFWNTPALAEQLCSRGDITTLGPDGTGTVALHNPGPTQISLEFSDLLLLAYEQGCKFVFLFDGDYEVWDAFDVVPWMAIKWGQSQGRLSYEDPDDSRPTLFSPSQEWGQMWQQALAAKAAIALSHELLAMNKNGADGAYPASRHRIEESTQEAIRAIGELAVSMYICANRVGIGAEAMFPTPTPLAIAQESYAISDLLFSNAPSQTALLILAQLWGAMSESFFSLTLQECAGKVLARKMQQPSTTAA